MKSAWLALLMFGMTEKALAGSPASQQSHTYGTVTLTHDGRCVHDPECVFHGEYTFGDLKLEYEVGKANGALGRNGLYWLTNSGSSTISVQWTATYSGNYGVQLVGGDVVPSKTTNVDPYTVQPGKPLRTGWLESGGDSWRDMQDKGPYAYKMPAFPNRVMISKLTIASSDGASSGGLLGSWYDLSAHLGYPSVVIGGETTNPTVTLSVFGAKSCVGVQINGGRLSCSLPASNTNLAMDVEFFLDDDGRLHEVGTVSNGKHFEQTMERR